MTTKQQQQQEQKERALQTLREVLTEGKTITVVLKYVSRYGSRRYSLLTEHKGEVFRLDYWLADAGIFTHRESRSTPNGIETTSSPDGLVNELSYRLYNHGNAFYTVTVY